MTIETVVLYTIVSFFYIVSPGPAIFLAIANGISANMLAVALSSLGNILGLFFLSFISIIGLGTLILASSTLFLLVKFIGAGYLIFLGYKQLKLSKTLSNPALQLDTIECKEPLSYFSEGLLLAVTNPKPILFFIAIFPQFLDVSSSLVSQFFIMTIIFMLISFSSLLSYGYLAKHTKKAFSSNTGMKWFHRITGGLFVGMGFGLLQLKTN